MCPLKALIGFGAFLPLNTSEIRLWSDFGLQLITCLLPRPHDMSVRTEGSYNYRPVCPTPVGPVKVGARSSVGPLKWGPAELGAAEVGAR